jgi:hypothetical protein
VQTSDVVDEVREEERGPFRGSAMTSGLVVANVEESLDFFVERSPIAGEDSSNFHSCFCVMSIVFVHARFSGCSESAFAIMLCDSYDCCARTQ